MVNTTVIEIFGQSGILRREGKVAYAEAGVFFYEDRATTELRAVISLAIAPLIWRWLLALFVDKLQEMLRVMTYSSV